MRTIKFRGKRTSGEWAYGSLIKFDIGYIILVNETTKSDNSLDENNSIVFSAGDIAVIIPDTIGQFIRIIPNTSMYVDNSQELYEGDLFTCGNSKTIYQAIYDGYGEYYGISNEGDKYGPYTVRLSRGNIKSQNIKICGNIHDNPELLKGGEE